MATVVVTKTAQDDLDQLIRTRDLPASARDRVKASLAQLATFPLLGRPLTGRWAGFRVVLGPWRWMLIIHAYDEAAQNVVIVTIQDSRSARAATSQLLRDVYEDPAAALADAREGWNSHPAEGTDATIEHLSRELETAADEAQWAAAMQHP